MKEIKLLAMFAFATVTMGIAMSSCSDDDNEDTLSDKDIKENIVGTWKLTSKNAQPVTTNERVVYSLSADSALFHSTSHEVNDGARYIWRNHSHGTYNLNNAAIDITTRRDSARRGTVTNCTFQSVSANQIVWKCNYVTFGSRNHERNDYEVYTKVSVDYTEAIVGLWEGIELTGEETYGDVNHRIEYKEDGTYVYYNKVDSLWIPKAQDVSEYNLHGDWLATRWKSEGEDSFNYEWWDVESCTDTKMEWSAYREKEDNTFFTTTFTWKKIK